MKINVIASILMLLVSTVIEARPEKVTVTGIVEEYKSWTSVTDNNGVSVMLPFGGKEEKKLLKKCKAKKMCQVTAIIDEEVDDADEAAKVLDAKMVK